MSGNPERTSFRFNKPRFDRIVPWGMVLLVGLAAAADDRYPMELVEFSPAADGPVFTGREGRGTLPSASGAGSNTTSQAGTSGTPVTMELVKESVGWDTRLPTMGSIGNGRKTAR